MINGEVMKVHFAEGHEVPTGALLFTIDPRQLQSALLQAQATLAQYQAAVMSAEANLARDMAQLENARVDEQRYRKLVEGGFVAREQYDQIRTKELTLAATIDADRAAVETAKALVAPARPRWTTCGCSSATPRSARPSAAAPATCC